MRDLIVSDSGCDLRHTTEVDGVPFASVPLTIRIGKREYRDDDDLNVRLLLMAIQAQKAAATTACPPPEAFAEVFRKADRVVCFTLSSGVSGTYNSAMIARSMVLEECPDKQIFVMDTLMAGGVMLLMIKKAAALLKREQPFEQTVRQLREYRRQRHILFTLTCYDNMVKTGRMSAWKGMLATRLGIHAIAQGTDEGQIGVVKKVRGDNATLNEMVRLMDERGMAAGHPVVIGHCRNETDAGLLAEKINARYGKVPTTILPTQGLTGFYVMEKGLLLAF